MKHPSTVSQRSLPALRPDYVDEGQFLACPLAVLDESLPLPPDASRIAHLAVASDGKVVYGATCGSAHHLFAAFFKGASGGILDLGAIPDAVDIPLLCQFTGNNGANKGLLAGFNGPSGFSLLRQPIPTMRDVLQEPWYRLPDRETVFTSSGRLFDALLLSEDRLLCLTSEGILDVNLRLNTGRHWPDSTAPAVRASRLARMDGHCYWIDAQRRIASVPIDLPDAPCRFGPDLPCGTPTLGWFSDSRSHLILADDGGRIFRFSPASGRIVHVADAPLPEIQCLACLSDGRLYGLCGAGIGHFFRCDLDSGTTHALGAVASAVGAAKRYAFEFACAAVSTDGVIFFGENDRGGHLWAYFPPLLSANKTL